jgi:hypothetical protein
MTFDIIVVFYIPLVALLLTSSPVMQRQECLWNFSVLQRVHISTLVLSSPYKLNGVSWTKRLKNIWTVDFNSVCSLVLL